MGGIRIDQGQRSDLDLWGGGVHPGLDVRRPAHVNWFFCDKQRVDSSSPFGEIR